MPDRSDVHQPAAPRTRRFAHALEARQRVVEACRDDGPIGRGGLELRLGLDTCAGDEVAAVGTTGEVTLMGAILTRAARGAGVEVLRRATTGSSPPISHASNGWCLREELLDAGESRPSSTVWRRLRASISRRRRCP